MKLRLWTFLRNLTGYARLTLPYGKGGWITVDERCLPQREIFVTGFYEPEVWESLSSRAASDEIVWDVGAHIGSFSIPAMLDSRVKEVHAFEPDPLHAEVLSVNLSLNRGRYILHPLALSNRHEKRTLYHGPLENSGLSSLIARSHGQRLEVDCLTADELVFQGGIPAPTLLKVDVEGWESRFFQGAERLLEEYPSKAIVVESEYRAPDEVANPFIANFLEKRGYSIRWIRRSSGLVEPRENFMATRNS